MTTHVTFSPVTYKVDGACCICHDSLSVASVVAHENNGQKHPIHAICYQNLVASALQHCPVCHATIRFSWKDYSIRLIFSGLAFIKDFNDKANRFRENLNRVEPEDWPCS